MRAARPPEVSWRRKDAVNTGPGSCYRGQPQFYAGDMNTVHLTDEELEIARHGMTAYLHTFGHDEADTLVLIRAVLARLAAARPEPTVPAAAG